MASIIQRRDVKNFETYKIAFKRKGFKSFYLCFDNRDAACEWVAEHEHKYFKDPDYYHNWKVELFLYMQKKKMLVKKHIRKPLIKIKS